jgi:hypothetical protein
VNSRPRDSADTAIIVAQASREKYFIIIDL